jgi:cysteine desulfurase
MARLRDRLFDAIRGLAPDASMVGSREHRSPANLSVLLPGLRSEHVLHALEERGVFASSGSACHAHETSQSHVLAAMGVPRDAAVIRLTLGKGTTDADVAAAAAAFGEALRALGRS